MLISCWSVKGGAGTSVVAASLAFELAARFGTALLVDLDGEQPTLLGLAEPDTDADIGPPVPLVDRAVAVGGGLSLLPTHKLETEPDADSLLVRLASVAGPVVVDCGCLGGRPAPHPIAEALAASATQSLLVIRPCYLALRRAVKAPLHPSGVIVVREPGRSLSDRDIADVLGAPVLATVPVSADVARVVDAGLLATRRPWPLRRALQLPVLV